jgi:hypothetical protein
MEPLKGFFQGQRKKTSCPKGRMFAAIWKQNKAVVRILSRAKKKRKISFPVWEAICDFRKKRYCPDRPSCRAGLRNRDVNVEFFVRVFIA